MHDERGERPVERRVCEGELLGRALPDVHTGVTLSRCRDERLRRIDRGDRVRAEKRDELARERAGAAADVQSVLARGDSGELDQLGCEPGRVAAHVPVVGFGCDGERHLPDSTTSLR